MFFDDTTPVDEAHDIGLVESSVVSLRDQPQVGRRPA
jgi:hypothetical protein